MGAEAVSRPLPRRRPWAALFWLCSDLTELFLRHLPGRLGPWNIGYSLRQAFWRSKCRGFGDRVLIHENVFLYFPHNITIGSNVSITANCILSAASDPGKGHITLKDDIYIGPGTYIFSANHDYSQPNIKRNERYITNPVVIESNVWIGAKVGILPGVTIGEGSVVAMGSVVTKDIPANSLAAGVPAAVIKAIRHGAGPRLEDEPELPR